MYLKGLVLVLLVLAATSVYCKKSKHSKSGSTGSKSIKSKSHSSSNADDGGVEDQNDDINPIIADVNAPAGGSRPGASVIIGGMVVEAYTTVTSSTLSSGIQCTGGDDAMWILPDGMTLTTTPSMNLMVQTLSSGSELLKVNNALPVGITGVFWCSVEYDTYTDIIPILIENTPSPPSITAQSCQFSGFNPMDDSFGIYVTANVSDGAPLSVACSVTHNSQTTLLDGRIYRQIHEAQSPVMTGVQVLVNVPSASVPSTVSCTISNPQGSDTLTCQIQSSSVNTPTMTSVVRDVQVSSLAKINWTPSNAGDQYMVYVSSASTRDYIPFQQMHITGSEAKVTGLYPGHSYKVFVAAAATTSSSNANQIIVPSISQTLDIPMSKCKPAQGQNIEIVLSKVNEDCEETALCSELTMDEKQDLAMSAITSCGTGQWNCSVVDPKVTKVYCNNEKTQSKKKKSKSSNKYGDIKLKAMAVCNACTYGTEEKDKTHKTPKRQRGRRSRVSRQLLMDSNDCNISFMGCGYTVSVTTKYDPVKVCGYDSMSSSTDSCDCPDKCFQSFARSCTNSCSCNF